ncbi:hypothetical protein HC031_20990 [Planosporangium thailandense]|uniref:Uncharacterized protein n=1 Tax=Planosporangium thailandense TaxID=765197 RepID=A0ABX0Y474_9ACTN|nr:hypothetical protein [Planosporangium thailandense]NJC72174.1 hypothetical protein [Planosporangium thailandense]
MSEDPQFHTVYLPDNYPKTTDAAVRYAPVTLTGRPVGYVWAAVTDDAGGFVGLGSSGADGFNAHVGWVARFRWAKANNVSPLHVLRHFAGLKEDERAGYVPDGAEQEAPSLDALKAVAAAG